MKKISFWILVSCLVKSIPIKTYLQIRKIQKQLVMLDSLLLKLLQSPTAQVSTIMQDSGSLSFIFVYLLEYAAE